MIPKDWDIVGGSGHQAYFNVQMRGRPAERYTTVREFGAVGNGLSYALGVAAARRQGRDGKLVLFEGDGGILFHIQELETIKRHGMRMLICVMNDGGYGSEFHKLRADGVDDSQAIFGRPAFESIARGFGLRGAEIRDISVIPKLFADFCGARAKARSGTSRFPTRSRHRPSARPSSADTARCERRGNEAL